MAAAVQTKLLWPLLGLGFVLLFSACSDKPPGDTPSVESAAKDEKEAPLLEDSTDAKLEAPEGVIEVSSPEGIPELGLLPENDYDAAFDYLSSVEDHLNGLGWDEFAFAADYLLTERDALIESKKMGDLVLTGRISDALTAELAARVVNGGVSTNEVREILDRYVKRPYDIRKLSEVLETEHGKKVKFRGSEADRYRELNKYATEMSGSDEELFSGINDDSTGAWYVEAKRSIISLASVYEAQKRTLALEALLNYLDRGGRTDLDLQEFIKSSEKLIPESFKEDTLPEFYGYGGSKQLHPSSVHRLIPKS